MSVYCVNIEFELTKISQCVDFGVSQVHSDLDIAKFIKGANEL